MSCLFLNKTLLWAKYIAPFLIKTFGFLGNGGGEALKYCNEAFVVPSDNTGRIQEAHITAGHALMEYVEDSLLDLGFIQLGVFQL